MLLFYQGFYNKIKNENSGLSCNLWFYNEIYFLKLKTHENIRAMQKGQHSTDGLNKILQYQALRHETIFFIQVIQMPRAMLTQYISVQ